MNKKKINYSNVFEFAVEGQKWPKIFIQFLKKGLEKNSICDFETICSHLVIEELNFHKRMRESYLLNQNLRKEFFRSYLGFDEYFQSINSEIAPFPTDLISITSTPFIYPLVLLGKIVFFHIDFVRFFLDFFEKVYWYFATRKRKM